MGLDVAVTSLHLALFWPALNFTGMQTGIDLKATILEQNDKEHTLPRPLRSPRMKRHNSRSTCCATKPQDLQLHITKAAPWESIYFTCRYNYKQ